MLSKYDSKCKGCGGEIKANVTNIEVVAPGSPLKNKNGRPAWVCEDNCSHLWASNAAPAPSKTYPTRYVQPTPSKVPPNFSQQQASSKTAQTTASATQSCIGCPSMIAAKDTEAFFGKATGMPMCGRFGKVLGAPGMKPVAEKFVADKIGGTCTQHGQVRPTAPPAFLDTMVATPMPDVLMKGVPTAEEMRNVNSCLNCENFIGASTVRSELGWTQPMCAATGRILLENRLKEEAANCQHRRRGTSSLRSTNGMNLVPLWVDAFSYDPDPVKAFLARKGAPLVDPIDHPTDEEVSDEDKALGIRAWKHVHNPDGSGRYVAMPIFDIASFTEEEQLLIPRTGDKEHPEWYVDVNGLLYDVMVSLMQLDETPALWGSAGIGKTEFGRWLAWQMCVPFRRISLNEKSQVEDLIGSKEFDPTKGTYFRYGRVVKAWMGNGVLLLDEPNTALDEVWQRIRPLTDSSKQLALDEADGEIIDRAPFCFPMLAMNPSWDARNIGTKELAAPDRDRLDHHLMHLPPRLVEREILRTRCEGDGFDISDEDLDKVLDVAEDIRKLVDGGFPISWGMRPNIKVARKLKWYDPLKAYRVAAVNDLEPDTGDEILNFVRSRWSL